MAHRRDNGPDFACATHVPMLTSVYAMDGLCADRTVATANWSRRTSGHMTWIDWFNFMLPVRFAQANIKQSVRKEVEEKHQGISLWTTPWIDQFVAAASSVASQSPSNLVPANYPREWPGQQLGTVLLDDGSYTFIRYQQRNQWGLNATSPIVDIPCGSLPTVALFRDWHLHWAFTVGTSWCRAQRAVFKAVAVLDDMLEVWVRYHCTCCLELDVVNTILCPMSRLMLIYLSSFKDFENSCL